MPDEDRESPTERPSMDRRAFLRSAALFTGTVAGLGGGLVLLSRRSPAPEPTPPAPAPAVAARPRPLGPYDTSEPITPWRDATTYNNYYEFGLGKDDPAREAADFRTRPWTVVVDGLVRRPQRIDVDTLTRWFPPEERIYRMRCVEAWSMVMPWSGFELGALIRRVEPLSTARYVAFTALHDPERMPGQLSDVLPWPYVEGLRLDEALHPLTLLATGLQGRPLPNQNGAPLRLVVPWKYGFKSIKAVARITFTREMPPTTWSLAAPDEYGFYANVNPAVDHPRWSQATERRIGDFARRPTLPFNGYADQVASLYAGMDLRRNF